MNSPTRQEQPQSSQIMSLVEALSTAQREIDSQGDRVKQLEVLLNRERKARESAEDRARRLLEGHFPDTANGHEHGNVDKEAFEPPLDTVEAIDRGLTNGYHATGDPGDDTMSDTSSMTTILPSSADSPEKLRSETEAVDASTSRLKERLELMVREMDEMKLTMETYKRRAEGAEEERNSLREMVEKIRANGTSSNGSISSPSSPASSQYNSIPSTSTDATSVSSLLDRNLTGSSQSLATKINGSAISNAIPDFKELERTVTSVLQQSQQQQRRQGGTQGVAMQSAPYASMVGVVLIGVGLMTWLNGWQRGER